MSDYGFLFLNLFLGSLVLGIAYIAVRLNERNNQNHGPAE